MALYACDGTAPPRSTPPADLILHGATVVLVDPPGATASAVAIRGDRILFAGSDEEALELRGPESRVVDLSGHTIIPGLIDAHGHVSSLGFALVRVDAVGTTSAEEAAARVREAARSARPGEWIRGRGWDQNDWPVKEFPSSRLLDEAAPRNPVVLGRICGHAIWVNSRALEIAGVTRETPDPPGGRIVRDPAGFPTGILVDNAEELVESKIPAPDRRQTREAILRALDRCLDRGLTGVHDAGISLEEAAIYRELAGAGELPIRIYAMLGGTSAMLGGTSTVLEDYFAEPPLVGAGGGFLTIRAIKLGIDGALGSRGAALMEPYADDPGNRGLITYPEEEIRALALRATAEGYQVCVHAIGDRGNKLTLDAFEAALRAGSQGDHRFRVEHAQALRPEEIRRFAASGIIASMQPTHCTSDMPWAEERLGPRRIRGAYAWRQILDTGAILAAGSDFPVESENPFLGIYAAVTRQDAEGNPPGGWHPGEKMTPEEALRAFTLGAAYASFDEGTLGSVSAGKKADLVILSGNPLAVRVSDLLEMRPEAVILDGRVVRSSDRLGKRLPLSPSRPAALE
jgi:predicted amidohydrolase YtcJ